MTQFNLPIHIKWNVLKHFIKFCIQMLIDDEYFHSDWTKNVCDSILYLFMAVQNLAVL